MQEDVIRHSECKSGCFVGNPQVLRELTGEKRLLLAVIGKTGSMHRLLQQAVLDLNTEAEAKDALSRCLWTLSQLWSFQQDSTDTWHMAGQLVEHIIMTPLIAQWG